MRNEIARKLLEETHPEIREKVKKYGEDMIIEKIIDDAYKLYMPQIREEITGLTDFIYQHRNFYVGKEQPYNILEIGTKFGGTFHIWNSINDKNGMNISIDMSDGGKHGGISEEDMDKRDLWFYERFDNCHFIRGDSHDSWTVLELSSILSGEKSLDILSGENNQKIDFLFIDGDHTYEGVKQDFEMYLPFVKKGGCIAFHDINDSERHRQRDVYVAKFWDEIKDQYESIEFNSNEDWGGIGVIVKR